MLNIMFVLELNINMTLKQEENAFTEQMFCLLSTPWNIFFNKFVFPIRKVYCIYMYMQRTPSKMGNSDLYSNQLLPFLY